MAEAKTNWSLLRVGYEWAFISNERSRFGVIGDFDHATIDANAHLRDYPADNYPHIAFSRTLLIPMLRGFGQTYIGHRVSLGGDVTVLELDRWRSSTLRDLDAFVTVNLAQRLGATIGFRYASLAYKLSNSTQAESVLYEESGKLRTSSPYIGVTIRF